MSTSNTMHTGYLSSIKYDDLVAWYTTVEDNEIIEFKDGDTQKTLNSLLIEAEATPLFIQLLPSEYCLYIPANSSRTYDFESIESIQVRNATGVKLRWSGMYY